MAGLTVEQIIKIILVVFVIVVFSIGIYYFFGTKVISFFRNIPGTEPDTIKSFLYLLK